MNTASKNGVVIMRNNKRTHAIKAALFSLLGILLLTGLYIGVNRFIFASATDREIHLDPFLPAESGPQAITLQMRLNMIPEGYPFPEFSIDVPDGIDEFMTPNTMSSDQAAAIISKYIWEMYGTDISGKTMFISLESFPSSTRTHWEGLVWSPHDVYNMVIHYRFSIDSVSGERIAISPGDWFPSGYVGENISSGNHETLVAFYTEIARDLAERHFHFTTVESVSYEGMRSLSDYQSHLICECREPRPCPTQTIIYEEHMYLIEAGTPMTTNIDGSPYIPTIQCQECGGGINQPFVYIPGFFPCPAIWNGETILDFIATDDTGRTARIAVSMETRRLNGLSTQHNDIIPGFDAQPDRETPGQPPTSTHGPSVSLYPQPGPHLTLNLGPAPFQETWTTQIPPDTDFHMFYMNPIHTINLTPLQDLPPASYGWQFIRFDFDGGRRPHDITVTRRRANNVGHNYSLEHVDVTDSGGWEGSFEYSIHIYDNGYDYFYFMRIVWEEGFTHQAFRVNSNNPPGFTPPTIGDSSAPGDSEQYTGITIPPRTVWDVQPTLNLGNVRQCNCGQFVNDDWQTIDPNTGAIIGDHLGHGGPPPSFVYDRERRLFGHPGYGFGYHDLLGMHPIDDFMDMINRSFSDFDWWLNPTQGLIAIEAVDSSRRTYYERESLNQYDELVSETFWGLNPEARPGRFALMNDREFVTGFDFDGVNIHYNNSEREMIPAFMAVSQNGKWGLVNWNGVVLIPFVFENLVIINQHYPFTAFARYNGRYGILDIPATVGPG